ncbi:HD domain-containing protein [Natronospora cellulosivora (SeqCode)]
MDVIMEYFELVLNEVKKIYTNIQGSHGWEHTERVYNLCLHIGEKEAADLTVIKYAAILHDIGRKEQDESNGRLCHAEIGAAKSRKILNKYDLNKDFIEKVIHCVETHRYRGENIPGSLEAKILFDADKLDAIGAIGIGRAFVFAGENRAKVHDKDVDIEKTKSYTEDDTAYREYLVKLRYIKDKLLTTEGKRLGKVRHDFMVEFFNRLNQEVEGLI